MDKYHVRQRYLIVKPYLNAINLTADGLTTKKLVCNIADHNQLLGVALPVADGNFFPGPIVICIKNFYGNIFRDYNLLPLAINLAKRCNQRSPSAFLFLCFSD